jgi:hypothetical protein
MDREAVRVTSDRYRALRAIADRLIAGHRIELNEVMQLISLLDGLPRGSMSPRYLVAVADALGRLRDDLASGDRWN